MEEFDSDDHERPIETYPGFIGMTMDYDFLPERQLRCLSNINWNRYTELREWVPDDHTVEVVFRRGPRQIRSTHGDSVVELLDQIPSVKVAHDPGGYSPGSATIYVFFIADDASEEELEHDVLVLEAALQSDFRTLEARHGQELDEIIMRRARKDMRKHGYEPCFAPEKRAYPDPANYPPNVDTTTIIPKKQTTIDADLKTIGAPETRKRLQDAYDRGLELGLELGNAEDGYAMGQLEAAFVKELGPEAGRKAFQERFATSMATTTGGASLTANLLMAQYGNYLRELGLPYPTRSYEIPYPVGGRYGVKNTEMHQRIFDEGGFTSLGEANPKRHNFAQNLMGNRRVATIDEQMTQGMTPGKGIPPPGKYGLYEQVLAQEAAKRGVLPASFQMVARAGFKNEPGKPMISHVNDAIERTHRLTVMPSSEIVRQALIKGRIPLY
jgi:hypothetical protein